MRFPFFFSKTWRVPARMKPRRDLSFCGLPAVAWLFVALLSAALTLRGAEESVVRIDRSRDGIAQLRTRLVNEGYSQEMGKQVFELTRQSDLRADEIALVVHYSVFCPDLDVGEVVLLSLIANRDFKHIKVRSSRRMVYAAFRYFSNKNMALVLNDIEGRLADLERARIANMSDADIRREIGRFKLAPDSDLRDHLRNSSTYLFELRRTEVLKEINAALLESFPGDPDLLVGKGILDTMVRDFVAAKESLAKAWQQKFLGSLVPYGAVIIQTDDLPAAASLANDLIRYQKWDEQIPKTLVAIGLILNKEPERYRATIEKILANVDAADLKNEDEKRLHESLMQSWKKAREQN